MTDKKDTVIIDPVAMNIVNRISAGSTTCGDLEFDGGVLLQGHHVGNLKVKNGPLVIFKGGSISGQTTVEGDAFVFGQVGSPDADKSASVLTVQGALHLTEESVSYGTLRFIELANYKGAQIFAALETLQPVSAPSV